MTRTVRFALIFLAVVRVAFGQTGISGIGPSRAQVAGAGGGRGARDWLPFSRRKAQAA